MVKIVSRFFKVKFQNRYVNNLYVTLLLFVKDGKLKDHILKAKMYQARKYTDF